MFFDLVQISHKRTTCKTYLSTEKQLYYGTGQKIIGCESDAKQPSLQADIYCFGARVRIEFGQDCSNVKFNGTFSNE